MSPPRSPSSPRGDDDPTPPRGARHDQWDDEEWDDDWQEPNFLIRRAIVVGAVVLAIALIAIVASRFIGGDDAGSSSTADVEWDTTVVLSSDEIRLLDRESGDEIDSIDSSIDLLDAQSLVSNDVLVTMTDDGAIGLIDLNDGTTRRGRAGPDESLTASTDNARIALAGPDGGGDVTIIDTAGRNVFSVADAAGLTSPLIFVSDIHVNPSGTHVAVPVPNAFQSFVLDVAEETSQAFAGRVIAISDELVVTEQPAGDEAEIEFHEIAGERLGSADVPAPRATLLTNDGSLLLVAGDGSVRRLSSDGTVDELDPVADADGNVLDVTSGFPALDGTRLVLVADGGDTVGVLDDDGTVLTTETGQVTNTATRSTGCLVVGSGTSSQPSNVVDLTDGSVVATIERGVPAATSVDGCTIALLGGTDNVVADGEVMRVDARSISDVSLDGDVVVVLDGTTTELVRIGDDDDPLEVADEPVVVRFGRRG